MFKLHDRVKETSYTQGTGNLTLRGAVSGFRAFSSVYADQDTFFYCITNNSNYEIGLGRYISGTDAIERVELFDSTTGSAINWGQGLKEIYVTYTASRSVYSDGNLSGNLVPFMQDEHLLTVDQNFNYQSGVLSVDSIFAASDIESPSLSTSSLDFGATEQTEPFLKNELLTYTSIEDVLFNSGEVNESLGLNKQTAGTFFAGPLDNCGVDPCEDDYPSFRPITSDDLPVISANKISYSPTNSGDWSTIPTNTKQALDYLAAEENLYLAKSNDLSDIQNAALGRYNLGVDASGTDNSTPVTISGAYDYITLSGQQLEIKQIDLDTDIFNSNTAFNKDFGSSGDQVASGNHLHDNRYYTEGEVDDLIALASGGSVDWGDISGTLSGQADLQSSLDGKEDTFSKNTGFNKDFGTTAGTVVEGNDARLSDARTPTTHNHDDRYYTETEVDILIASSSGTPVSGVNVNELSDIEVGSGNSAPGFLSSAFGYQSLASGEHSSVFGHKNTVASVATSGSSAVGYKNSVGQDSASSSAFGNKNLTTSFQSSAFGYNNRSAAEASAVGANNTANGSRGSAFGYNNTASSFDASAIGHSNVASDLYACAFGYDNNSNNDECSSFGIKNISNGNRASCFGYQNYATGIHASAFGYENSADGTDTSAFGYGNNSIGPYCSTFGYANDAEGSYSSAIGRTNYADNASSAVGYINKSYSNQSSAFGSNNIASGLYSSSHGYNNITFDNYSAAFGAVNIADGTQASAFGSNNVVSGVRSCGFGNDVRIGDQYCQGFGSNLNIENTNSTAYYPITELGANSFDGVRSAIRLSDGKASVPLKNDSTAPTDGGADPGEEDYETIPREMYSIRRNGDIIFIDVNIGGIVKTLQLGTVT